MTDHMTNFEEMLYHAVSDPDPLFMLAALREGLSRTEASIEHGWDRMDHAPPRGEPTRVARDALKAQMCTASRLAGAVWAYEARLLKEGLIDRCPAVNTLGQCTGAAGHAYAHTPKSTSGPVTYEGSA